MKETQKTWNGIQKTCQNCEDFGGCCFTKGKEPTEVCENWKLDFMTWQKATEGMDINEIDKLSRKKW